MNPMKMRIKYCFIAGLLLLIAAIAGIAFYLIHGGSVSKDAKEPAQTGIFSWSASLPSDAKQQEQLDFVIDRLCIGRVFQEFPDDPSADEEIPGFIHRLSKEEITCYALLGQPDWALSEHEPDLQARLQRISIYNNAHSDAPLTGVMLDVEPYLLPEWDQDPDALMKEFSKTMAAIYQYNKAHDLDTILCIPYWYDNDYPDVLETLIRDCCDEIAVMNYYIGEESKHMETELALCRTYKKPINCISEFQKPGSHDLTDKITYYNRGIDAARAAWKQLEESSDYKRLSFSYHYLDPVFELLQKDS